MKEPKSELITTLMNHILKLNECTFNNTIYFLTNGCVMGTIASPSYANNLIRSFEEKFIYPDILTDILRYTVNSLTTFSLQALSRKKVSISSNCIPGYRCIF